MRPALSSHVVRLLCAVPFVNEVERLAVVFHLRQTWHLRQHPLPLLIVASPLPIHVVPHCQNLWPVTI